MARIKERRVHDVQRQFQETLCSEWPESLRGTSAITNRFVVTTCAIVKEIRLVQFPGRFGIKEKPVHSHSNRRRLSQRLNLLPLLLRLPCVTPCIDPVRGNFSTSSENFANIPLQLRKVVAGGTT